MTNIAWLHFNLREKKEIHTLKQKTQKAISPDGFLQCLLIKNKLTAAHAVTAIEAFVTGTAANGNVPAGITCRCIALHIDCSPVYSV